MITHCSAATFYSVSISEPIPIRLGKNLTKFYKIFRTELDSVRKQKTIFKARKNSEPNPIRFGKKLTIF